jgi:hypothetical protein
MTVWLIVFLLSNGEQAKVSSEWQPSKYECERLRHTLKPDANAEGWTTRCLAWEIPEDFNVVRTSDAEALEASNCDNSQVLRRLQLLANKIDAVDDSVEGVGSSAKNLEISLRDIERSVNRVDGYVHTLRCYR